MDIDVKPGVTVDQERGKCNAVGIERVLTHYSPYP
jgi:hypothetical protein